MSRREADYFSRTAPTEVLAGHGASTARLRAVAWDQTRLGAVEAWPDERLSAVRTVLAASAPMALWAGDEFHQVHNDALVDLVGAPLENGRPAEECWPDGWRLLGGAAHDAVRTAAPVVLHELAVQTGADMRIWTVQLSPIRLAGSPAVDSLLVIPLDRTSAALSAERERETAATLTANLQNALTSNRRIGTAVGILMAQRRITDTAAFELMRTASQHTHRKLRDIAEDVLLTGTLPGE